MPNQTASTLFTHDHKAPMEASGYCAVDGVLGAVQTRDAMVPRQWNFNVGLSEQTKADLSPERKNWLGLGLTANVKPLGGVN